MHSRHGGSWPKGRVTGGRQLARQAPCRLTSHLHAGTCLSNHDHPVSPPACLPCLPPVYTCPLTRDLAFPHCKQQPKPNPSHWPPASPLLTPDLPLLPLHSKRVEAVGIRHLAGLPRAHHVLHILRVCRHSTAQHGTARTAKASGEQGSNLAHSRTALCGALRLDGVVTWRMVGYSASHPAQGRCGATSSQRRGHCLGSCKRCVLARCGAHLRRQSAGPV